MPTNKNQFNASLDAWHKSLKKTNMPTLPRSYDLYSGVGPRNSPGNLVESHKRHEDAFDHGTELLESGDCDWIKILTSDETSTTYLHRNDL